MWNLPAPLGFQGLREDLPLEVYVRHLPHWRQEGATFFATFRLADSLPKLKLEEIAALRCEWEREHPPPWQREVLEELGRKTAEHLERWLDQGMGCCVLKDPCCSALVTEAMHHFDDTRYELGAFVVMPNHAHVLVRPLQGNDYPLEAILGSWKQFSSKRINKRLGTKGEIWQERATTVSCGMKSTFTGAFSISAAIQAGLV